MRAPDREDAMPFVQRNRDSDGESVQEEVNAGEAEQPRPDTINAQGAHEERIEAAGIEERSCRNPHGHRRRGCIEEDPLECQARAREARGDRQAVDRHDQGAGCGAEHHRPRQREDIGDRKVHRHRRDLQYRRSADQRQRHEDPPANRRRGRRELRQRRAQDRRAGQQHAKIPCTGRARELACFRNRLTSRRHRRCFVLHRVFRSSTLQNSFVTAHPVPRAEKHGLTLEF